MTEPDFRTTAELLKGEGFSTTERYDAEAFGSWLVEVKVDPRLRVVWDGKDGWLIVQRKTTELFDGQPVWDDLWVARDPDEQSPEAALKVVLRETNQPGIGSE